jgi:hypothetical protein
VRCAKTSFYWAGADLLLLLLLLLLLQMMAPWGMVASVPGMGPMWVRPMPGMAMPYAIPYGQVRLLLLLLLLLVLLLFMPDIAVLLHAHLCHADLTTEYHCC